MDKIQKNTLVNTIFIAIVCSVIFFLNTQNLQSWLVDDAGISFAYSRSLAQGYGLVAQPGAQPVEGFSNPTWVFLFSGIELLGLDILAASKIVSLILSIGVIIFSSFISCKISQNILLSFISLLWIVLQPGLVIWFSSGLENPLYVLLILWLVWLTLKEPSNKVSILAGLIAALIALTRPEGIVYAIGFLVLRPKSWKPYLLTFFLFFGTFFIFRLIYFGYPLPNTFYMKAGGRFQLDQMIRQIYYNFRLLGNGILGRVGFWVGIMPLLFLFALIIKKKLFEKVTITICFFSGLALFSYLVLPADWMAELRFASPILTLCPIILAGLIALLTNKEKPVLIRPIGSIVISIFLIWIVTNYFTDYHPRIDKFAESPTVDLKSVQASAVVYSELAKNLHLSDFAVLQADVGGALWLNQYRVIDLGGLVDSTIARTLDQDQDAFHEYVFTEIKPEMIELHGKWALRADLESSPDFESDYRAVYSSVDSSRLTEDGRPVINGLFIRKELITNEEQFLLLQETIEP